MKIKFEVDISSIIDSLVYEPGDGEDYLNKEISEELKFEIKSNIIKQLLDKLNIEHYIESIKSEIYKEMKDSAHKYLESIKDKTFQQNLIESIGLILYREFRTEFWDNITRKLLSDPEFMKNIIKELKQ